MLDPRNESGLFDNNNPQHNEILREHFKKNLCEAFGTDPRIDGEPCMLDEEGKHPDRQAYNKEGWLVTFPSKEYKDKAIKKGTHFASDPTHGKGGMNLYYKKKGKQQRQKQQDVSSTDQRDDVEPTTTEKPSQQNQSPQQQNQTPQDQQNATPKKDDSGPTDSTPQQDQSGPKSSDKPLSDEEAQAEEEADRAEAARSSSGGESTDGEDEQSQLNGGQSGGQPQKPQQPPAPKFAPITLEFASSKGWSSTPYGDWKSKEGEVVAVTSLSGEVTPIQSVLRDELKLFVQKKLQK
jgi:hypothetical protein